MAKQVKIKSAEALDKLQKKLQAAHDPDKTVITVCGGTGCLSNGAAELAEALRKKISQKKLKAKVELIPEIEEESQTSPQKQSCFVRGILIIWFLLHDGSC